MQVTDFPVQFGVSLITRDPFIEELDAFFDPEVAVFDGIPLCRYVVRQIPTLEIPDFHVVRLQQNDGIDGRAEFRPVLLLLVFVGIDPEQVRGDPTQSQQDEVHGGTRGIDVTQGAFPQFMFDT